MSTQHSSSHTHQFGFTGQEPGLYGGNTHFSTARDAAERRDYMAIDDASSMPHPHHTGSSYPQNFHYGNGDQQHYGWTLNINSHSPYHSQGEMPFVHYFASDNALHEYGMDTDKYNVYDNSFSSVMMHELLPPSSVAISLDATLIHPSRSAPPSCSSSPHVPPTFVGYLDVPTIMDGPISREQSPAQSETDPSDARRRFPCLMEGCARRFTSQYTLRVHMEAHKPKAKPSFPCQLGCSERFSRQHDRLRHEVSKHGKICEFLCDDCGRFFSSRKTLGNHKCPVAHGTTRWMNS